MSKGNGWERTVEDRLALFGHRNWIVVADAAYPLQTRAGIETVCSGESHAKVLKQIVRQLSKCGHVRPRVYIDAELDHVAETDAPGVSDFREAARSILAGAAPQSVLHETLISRLDEAAKLFAILIVKTTATIPYTTVFFELDCGYWSDEAESRMRADLTARKRAR